MSYRSDSVVDEAGKLWEALYQRLKAIAISQVSGEFSPGVLQPTALVNEAWLRMSDLRLQWQSRSHFLAMAARVMRRVLVDHARAEKAAKRDARLQVTLSSQLSTQPAVDVINVHHALETLATQDQRSADIVEMHYFGGLTYLEMAQVLDISEATVKRQLRSARAWLTAELAD